MEQMDPQLVIFRDDDVGFGIGKNYVAHRLEMLNTAQKLYNKYNVIHEIGYVTGTQQNQKETTHYLCRQHNVKIQFHAHDHCDFTTLSEKQLRQQFESGIKTIEDIFNKNPTRWFPPYHRWNDLSNNVAKEFGLTLDKNETMSLSYFILNWEKCIKTPPPTVCHHFWSKKESDFLENAFIVYRKLLETNLTKNTP